jgi:cold shock CspA family protein
MARARDTFNKKDQEKARLKKRKDKEQRKEDRKANSGKGKGLDDMIAYVDAYGNILSTPPDPKHKQDIKPEDIKISTSKKEDLDPASLIRSGTVTFFNNEKGYGFIKDDETEQTVFVHINDLEKPIKENDRVTFETERGLKGLNAVRVKAFLAPAAEKA